MSDPSDTDPAAPPSGQPGGPDAWLGNDPVEHLSATLQQGLQHLAREMAALRAERDGLRLELEGLRAQLHLAQDQVARREVPRPSEPAVAERTGPARPLDPRLAPRRVLPPVEPDVAAEVAEPRWRGVGPAERTFEDFFDRPAEWLGEPRRHHRPARRWPARLAAGVVGVLAVAVLLVTVGPLVLPYETSYVRSGSMEPRLATGALIVSLEVDADDLDVGDVITFERPDRPGTLVTHRIVGIDDEGGRRTFATQGDTNRAPDPWEVSGDAELAELAFDVPYLGYAFQHLDTTEVRIALLVVPALLLGIGSLLRARRRAVTAGDHHR